MAEASSTCAIRPPARPRLAAPAGGLRNPSARATGGLVIHPAAARQAASVAAQDVCTHARAWAGVHGRGVASCFLEVGRSIMGNSFQETSGGASLACGGCSVALQSCVASVAPRTQLWRATLLPHCVCREQPKRRQAAAVQSLAARSRRSRYVNNISLPHFQLHPRHPTADKTLLSDVTNCYCSVPL